MEQFNSFMTWFFIAAIAGESLVSILGQYKWYDLKDSAVNLTLAFLNVGLDLLLKGFTYFILNWFYQFAVFEWTSTVWLWVSLILLEDLAYYTLHWVDHHVRFFWAIHVNHHSSQHMNFSVAIRSSVLQPLYRFVYFIPLALLGFQAWQIMLAYAICNAWGFFIHTESIGKLGILEKIFSTPSNHRVHHGSNPHYLDRNMGMFLIIWDRIFGTYQEENEKVIYGLTKNIESDNIPHVIFHEWKNIYKDVKSAPGLRNKLMYVFGPPGWSHDGRSVTSKAIRKEYFAKKQKSMKQSNNDFVAQEEMVA